MNADWGTSSTLGWGVSCSAYADSTFAVGQVAVLGCGSRAYDSALIASRVAQRVFVICGQRHTNLDKWSSKGVSRSEFFVSRVRLHETLFLTPGLHQLSRKHETVTISEALIVARPRSAVITALDWSIVTLAWHGGRPKGLAPDTGRLNGVIGPWPGDCT